MYKTLHIPVFPLQKALLILLLTTSTSTLLAAEVKGVVEWYRLTSLSFYTSGMIAQQHATPGTTVKAGAPIISLEDQAEKMGLEYRQQSLKLAEMEMNEADRELERIEDLFQRDLISQHDHELGKAAQQRSRVSLALAKTELASAHHALKSRSVRAPFDAIVLSIESNIGETINSNLEQRTVVEVADAESYRVTINLTKTQFNRLSPEDTIVVKAGSQQIDATIRELNHYPKPLRGESSQYQALLTLSKKGLTPGNKVIVKVP